MTQQLYDLDFNQWVVAQADALRMGNIEALDLDNLLEEIEDMAG